MRKLLILAAVFFLVRWSEVSYQFTPTGHGLMPHVNRKSGERRFWTLKEAQEWADMMFPPESGVRKEMQMRIVKVEETEITKAKAGDGMEALADESAKQTDKEVGPPPAYSPLKITPPHLRFDGRVK